MRVKTVLNINPKFTSFHFGKAFFDRDRQGMVIELRPRKNSRPICGECGRRCQQHDVLPERDFKYLPIFEFDSYFRYAPRRCRCPHCGRITSEAMPWSTGKSPVTKHLALHLANWAREIPISSVSEHFHVSWKSIAQSVQWVVEQGLKERDLSNIQTIGIDEVSFHGKSDYFTLVYQIDEGHRRLLWVGDNRTRETMRQFFSEMGVEMLRKDPSLYDRYLREHAEGGQPSDAEECSGQADSSSALVPMDPRTLLENLESQVRQLNQLESEGGSKVLSPEESSDIASTIAELRSRLMTRMQAEETQEQDLADELPEAVKSPPHCQEAGQEKEADEKDSIDAAESEPTAAAAEPTAAEAGPTAAEAGAETANETGNSGNAAARELSTQRILMFLITQFAMSVKVVCTDMWRPYLSMIAEYLPNALNVLDRFHVMKKFGEAIDKVRNDESKRLAREGSLPVLTGTRYCFLKRPENLTSKQALKLKELIAINLKTTRAYLLKEQFQELWSCSTPEAASQFMEQWMHAASRSKIEPMVKISGMLKRHQELILNYFRTGKTFSSGVVEGLNRKVNLTVRKAYGFRSRKFAKVYLYHQLGKLPVPKVIPKL